MVVAYNGYFSQAEPPVTLAHHDPRPKYCPAPMTANTIIDNA